MKIADSTTAPTFLMTSSLAIKKKKPTKPVKFNRQLNNSMVSLSNCSPPITFPINNYQIIPVTPFWANSQLTSSSQTVTRINTNATPSPPVITPPSINQQRQDTVIYPAFKSFTTPRVTTTLIPLNVCHTEYCQTEKAMPTPSINIIENHQEQNPFEQKPKRTITTHLIGDWIIRESSEPFQKKEKEQSSSKEQLSNQEKKVISNESITSCQSSLPNVNQWTTDKVCWFFERILGKNCYTSMIKEHLIDGAALLLLQDEHLITIFKMQLGPRLKLLNRINRLKNGDFSGL